MTQETDEGQLPLNLKRAGDIARDSGIQRAVEHAEAVDDGWADRARHFLHKFLAQRTEFPRQPFTSLDFRTFAEGHGLGAPPDARAYGGIFQWASRREFIEANGFINQANPTRHNAPVRQWVKHLKHV